MQPPSLSSASEAQSQAQGKDFAASDSEDQLVEKELELELEVLELEDQVRFSTRTSLFMKWTFFFAGEDFRSLVSTKTVSLCHFFSGGKALT